MRAIRPERDVLFALKRRVEHRRGGGVAFLFFLDFFATPRSWTIPVDRASEDLFPDNSGSSLWNP